MTELLLIRHAQSLNNAKPEHQRVPDPGLTELGHKQADCVARWLRQNPITRLYSSPFLRALLTVEAIANETGLPVHVRADVFEQGGCYRGHLPGEEIGQPGMSRTQILARFPDWPIDDRIGELGWWQCRPYESWEQAMARARSVVAWLSADLSQVEGCHAIVTHGDFKMLLVQELLTNSTNARIGRPFHNTSVTRFLLKQGRWELDWYNSAQHLPVELLTL
jgi:2,3-bisphosphoglycerate-dependent phosphoglycerate mutase